MSTTKSFEKLINDFNRIHKIEERLPTFMEISRYPHFENVCSNILNFYFDTTQPHKLKDLVLKSLLQCTSFQFENYPQLITQNCHREYCTPDNKRIDLVIEGDDFVVAIENKIFHILNNDLKSYEDTVDNEFPHCNKKIFIVLSVKRENILKSNFISITYESFFEKLKQNIGTYAVNANNQYVTYLLDFIKTIENHYKMENTNKEMFDFLINNGDAIDAINQQKIILENQLKNLVYQVSENIREKLPNINNSVYDRDTIVFEIHLDSFTVTVDLVIELQNNYAELFIRDKKNPYEELNQLNLLKNNSLTKSNRGYTLFSDKQNFYEINQDELATKISSYLIQIKK